MSAPSVSGDLAPSGLFTVDPPDAEVRVGGLRLRPAGAPGRFRVPPFAAPGTPIAVGAAPPAREVADPGPTTWVVPLAGQSNMVGRADADGSDPWPPAVRFVAQDGRPFAPAAEIRSADADAGPFLIAKRFAADFLRDRPHDSLVFVPGAVGGTSFWNHRWNPGDDLYDNLVALTGGVLAANPAWRLRAMLFQGFETDAKNGMQPTTFRRAIDRFVKAVRADLAGPELPIVFGELPPGFVEAEPVRGGIRDEVRLATRRLPFTAVAACRAPERADDDGLHFSTAGLLAIGGCYAGALADADANAPAAEAAVG
jgi:hypothetical protein